MQYGSKAGNGSGLSGGLWALKDLLATPFNAPASCPGTFCHRFRMLAKVPK
jgi:hypothetical protein